MDRAKRAESYNPKVENTLDLYTNRASPVSRVITPYYNVIEKTIGIMQP